MSLSTHACVVKIVTCLWIQWADWILSCSINVAFSEKSTCRVTEDPLHSVFFLYYYVVSVVTCVFVSPGHFSLNQLFFEDVKKRQFAILNSML